MKERFGRHKSDKSGSDQWLVKSKQHFVDLEGVVVAFQDEVFDDDVEFTAVRQGIWRMLLSD